MTGLGAWHLWRMGVGWRDVRTRAEAVEEAVYNSLLRATDVTDIQGHKGEALPIVKLRDILSDRTID